jgi:hypothetical protein
MNRERVLRAERLVAIERFREQHLLQEHALAERAAREAADAERIAEANLLAQELRFAAIQTAPRLDIGRFALFGERMVMADALLTSAKADTQAAEEAARVRRDAWHLGLARLDATDARGAEIRTAFDKVEFGKQQADLMDLWLARKGTR